MYISNAWCSDLNCKCLINICQITIYLTWIQKVVSYKCCVLPAFILIIYKGYKQGSEGGKR